MAVTANAASQAKPTIKKAGTKRRSHGRSTTSTTKPPSQLAKKYRTRLRYSRQFST
jgi:hypothetical protein